MWPGSDLFWLSIGVEICTPIPRFRGSDDMTVWWQAGWPVSTMCKCHHARALSLPRLLADVKRDTGSFLQIADDAEEIARLRIAARAEHAN
jgi:hypothetical protein